MRPFRHLPAIVAVSLTLSGRAGATDEPGPAELGRGQAAWLRGDFDEAEQAFAKAIQLGHLAKKQLLDAEVLLGSARTVRGNKAGALVAFRQAALLDAAFKVPREAGRKAAQLADSARKQAQKIGTVDLLVEAPREVTEGESFEVKVSMDPVHTALFGRMVLHTEVAGKSGEFEESPASSILFRLPGTAAGAPGELAIHARGLDAHDNEMVTRDVTVRVNAAKSSATEASKEPPVAPSAVVSARAPEKGVTQSTRAKKAVNESKSGGGFWSSPWPWLIGGAVVVGAGTAFYFYRYSPTGDVNVSQVRVSPI